MTTRSATVCKLRGILVCLQETFICTSGNIVWLFHVRLQWHQLDGFLKGSLLFFTGFKQNPNYLSLAKSRRHNHNNVLFSNRKIWNNSFSIACQSKINASKRLENCERFIVRLRSLKLFLCRRLFFVMLVSISRLLPSLNPAPSIDCFDSSSIPAFSVRREQSNGLRPPGTISFIVIIKWFYLGPHCTISRLNSEKKLWSEKLQVYFESKRLR